MSSLLERLLAGLLIAGALVGGGGYALASVLRFFDLRWTWALLGLVAGMLLRGSSAMVVLGLWGVSLVGCLLGLRWQREDELRGGEVAQAARARVGVVRALREGFSGLQDRRARLAGEGWLEVGVDRRRTAALILAGDRSGSHTLVLGATGSGKTVTQTWIVARMIDGGRGALVIDPKGDGLLREQLEAAAARRGAEFLEWTPEGPLAYNPYAHGAEAEIADKALAGELFTEPHYLRQAQRYLGHAVRAMFGAGITVTPGSLMEHLDPRQLEITSRALPEGPAETVQGYLDSLTDRQRRDLSGVRDRLSILVESEVGRWLDPSVAPAIDLREAIVKRSVVYFRLDSDRRPLLAKMLAAALISDLITVVADLQDSPVATAVLIDEFSAVAAGHVARLFGRARSAGISLILGTQELADLKAVGDGALREQVLGNVQSIVAHRQNVPESARLIAEIAGVRPTWIHTQQTRESALGSAPSGRGSRKAGEELVVPPDRIQNLKVGEAVVITLGSGREAVIADIHHPREV